MEIPSDISRLTNAMDTLQFDCDSPYFYEVMSGALVWDDEKTGFSSEYFSPVEIGLLRMIWAFRSGLILGSPRLEFESVWRRAQDAAPNWPGFRAERCSPSEEVILYLKTAKRRSDRNFDRYEKASAGAWKPLSGQQSEEAEQAVAPNRSLPPSLNSTSPVRGSED